MKVKIKRKSLITKGNCPICSEEGISQTLRECKREDNGYKCYTCSHCKRIFDYNSFTPCCGYPGTIITVENIENPSKDVILKYYCLYCRKQYDEKRVKNFIEPHISEK